MKTIIAFISFFVVSSLQAADVSALSCSAQVFVSPEYVSGYCANNQCSATVFPNRIWTHGYCDKGVTFSADAQARILFLSGTCINGSISIYKNSDYYNWSGRCSNGGFFSAFPTFIQPQYLMGNCSENGTMSVYIPSDYIRLDAQCTE